MADLADETRSLSMNSEDGDDEEFGFVKRDSAVLAAALTSRKSSTASSSAAATDNAQSGSGDGERDDLRRASGREGQATVDNSYPYKTEVRDAEPSKGILKPPSVTGKSPFESKKKTSTASRTEDELGELPKSAKKQSGLMKRMSVAAKTTPSGPAKEDLPQVFQVKYLGQRDARGLWGIKHTRRPVDEMVNAAKSLKVGTVLPLVKLAVTKDGIVIMPITSTKTDADERQFHSIDTISYGVQDLVYTRVFSMIIVKDSGRNARDVHPFECHAFVCESRHSARRLTYSLASAFQEYSRAVNAAGTGGKEKVAQIKKRFAIDLRSPDEIEADLEEETEA